jgi:hypothetical protein
MQMTKDEVIELFQTLLLEHSPEELKTWFVEVVGGEPTKPVDSPILEPYRPYLEAEAKKIQKLKGQIGSKEPNKFQAKMLLAYDAIVAYFNRLVEVGGDITKAGEIPRQQWNANSGFLSGWGLVDARPRVVVYINGDMKRPFLAGNISSFVHDARTILDGNTDPTGMYWAPYNIRKSGDTEQTFPCWNVLELTDAYKPSTEDDDLDLIRNFDLSKGSLRMDPKTWSEPFRTAWFEGHPDYEFSGVSKKFPWTKG